MKFSTIWLILILIGGLLPISIAQSQTNEEYLGEQNEENIAGEMVHQLTKLSTLIDTKISPIKDKLPPKILEDYKKAEEFKEKAFSEYQNGKYKEAIQDILRAMRYYKEILKSPEAIKERPELLKQEMMEENARVTAYFIYIEKIIKLAQINGIDTEDLVKAYENTKNAYKEALEDLHSGNLENAKNSLLNARKNRTELDQELRKVVAELTSKNAETIVKSFLVKTSQSLTVAKKAMKNAKERGLKTEEAELEIKRVSEIYLQVENLAREEKWEEALRIIRENGAQMERFFRAVGMVRMKNTNMVEVLESTKERIKRDATALVILKNKGVNTARAEVQLKGAINEFSISINLLKKNDINRATFHLQRADKLLREVEEFIKANS